MGNARIAVHVTINNAIRTFILSFLWNILPFPTVFPLQLFSLWAVPGMPFKGTGFNKQLGIPAH